MNYPFEIINARLSNIENLLLDIRDSERGAKSLSAADELLTVQDGTKFLSISYPTVKSRSLEMWKQHILKLSVDFILHLLVALIIHYLF